MVKPITSASATCGSERKEESSSATVASPNAPCCSAQGWMTATIRSRSAASECIYNGVDVARPDVPAMPQDNRPSIADAPSAGRARRAGWAALVAVIIAGTAGAIHYAANDLTLSHYDARAHLVVARRIIDSLTPGWRQIGAVWLPLPHIVGIPAVWSDWGYRTGYPGVAMSVVLLAAGLARLAAFVAGLTGSAIAALTAAALIILNPNVLYSRARR